jgi:hypothetical protein
MQDLFYIVATLAFFAISILYTAWLERLRKGAQDE